MNDLTQSRLKELLQYSPSTGLFTWKMSRRGRAKSGSVAGTKTKASNPYLLISIDSKQYYAHRLAWIYMYGEAPLRRLTHLDGDHSNNRIANLTLLTNPGIERSILPRIESISVQVEYYEAFIVVDRIKYSLGYFSSKKKATEAWLKAAYLESVLE